MANITTTAAVAEGLAAILRPHGVQVAVEGDTVTIPEAGLGWLADLDEEADGHFDGKRIWVDGYGHLVS